MAGAKGRSGRRPGSTTIQLGFRGWCRSVVEDPEVRALIEAEAKKNPEFALKVAEHGYGRPPQALDVSLATREGALEFVATFADGSPATPCSSTVPDGPAEGPIS